jgi:hypothetical protein
MAVGVVAVGMVVPIVVAGVVVARRRNHRTMLYYNITGVY